MNPALASRLFSRATTAVLSVAVLGLMCASFYTYVQDRQLQSVSLGNLRMASWGLTQTSNEAHEFDKTLALVLNRSGDSEELMLRYDVLWSRYDYLLNSNESRFTRNQLDNTRRLKDLFSRFKAMEPDVLALVSSSDQAASGLLWQEWQSQKLDLHQLLIDNFVGDETSSLMRGIQQSRDRLSNLRIVTLAAMVTLFLYLVVALRHLRARMTTSDATGLPNEYYLKELKSLDFNKGIVACEIRDFQLLTANYDAADTHEIVRSFVRKLSRSLNSADEIVQVAPGEFVIVATLPKERTVEQFVLSLQRATSFSWRLGSITLGISAFFGIAHSVSAPTMDFQEYLRYATRALSQCKNSNTRITVFNDSSRAQLFREHRLHSELARLFQGERSALKLSLVYQPIVDIDDIHSLKSAEVLLRCQDEGGDPIAPDWLVEVCENHGLGLELGRWVFRQVAGQAQRLFTDFDYQGTIAINLSPSMLGEHLLEEVERELLDKGMPASAICLEITEDSAGLNLDKVNAFMAKLKARGISLALDDFGTGHSSLAYLQNLQIDRLKIDRSFVKGIEKDDDKKRFLGSIVAMSRQSYMTAIVEGVENEHQWELIKGMGHVFVQGYFAHRPMPLLQFMELLQAPDFERTHQTVMR